MPISEIKSVIQSGKTALGIELGSSRIKAVLLDHRGNLLASGCYAWENQLEAGIWTYHLEQALIGLSKCYCEIADYIKSKYGICLMKIGVIGVSAMMHGYLVFDSKNRLLVPFRTWRNTITKTSSEILTELFNYNIPQRWCIAHLYQAILNNEKHINDISFITTLSGYVHWRLTGKKCLGIGDASGMFPMDYVAKDYNQHMIEQFNSLIKKEMLPWKLQQLLPDILVAGEKAGKLTKEGAEILDPSGKLQPGIPFCPPEGDAATGMVATNSIAPKMGNISAGTSVFASIVLEKSLSKAYSQIDIVATPEGLPAAMVHCNNCTSDLNAWIGLFQECLECFGVYPDQDKLYDVLYHKISLGDKSCKGFLAYNYLSGEHITGIDEGRPLFCRMPESQMNLADFFRTHVYTSFATLKLGLDILTTKEAVTIKKMIGHGGFFKSGQVGQKIMASVVGSPVSVLENAGEGGAWGIALLASFMKWKKAGETLQGYLKNKIFCSIKGCVEMPSDEDIKGFNCFMKRYKAGFLLEKTAIDNVIM